MDARSAAGTGQKSHPTGTQGNGCDRGRMRRALIDGRHLVEQFDVVWSVPRLVPFVPVVQFLLVKKREEQHPPTVDRAAAGIRQVRRRKRTVFVMIIE